MPGVAEALQRRVQPFVAAHKFGVYAFLSVAAVLAITVNALRGHSNFYSVTVYLSRNSRTLIVCTAIRSLRRKLIPFSHLGVGELWLSHSLNMRSNYAENILWTPSPSRSRGTSLPSGLILRC